ncbi:MAG: 2,3-bisphosphoglycerate-independent phosphoglycerate mutase [Methanomassiliicoccales archaeon]
MLTRKILIVVMDGLGDRAVKELQWKTPLQAANRPNLNWFAEQGATGIVDVISPGIRPGSDTSHLAILGYDPYRVYTGRGPIEAAGIGIEGRHGDIALRCNFATVDSEMNVLDRRAGRIKEPETTFLVEALNGLTIEGVDIIVKEATEHRAVLLLRGKGLSAKVTDVDPHAESRVQKSRALEPEARKTARVINQFVKLSYEVLDQHPINVKRREQGKPPANILLPRGAGIFPDIQKFSERYGLKGACVAGVSLIKGVCRLCGIDVVDISGATGGLDTNMISKAQKALQLLQTYDFVLMNIKATDIASHDKNAKQKVNVIEQLDEMAGILRQGLSQDVVIAFMADHCTPIEVGDHTGDPVPFMIYCKGIVPDTNTRFDEGSCSQGGLGRIRGMDVLPILLDKAGRSEKFGA